YGVYWSKMIRSPFALRLSAGFFTEDVLGQLLGIALPEEAFSRGYLQSALDKVWPPKYRVLGAMIGPSLLVSSVIFALGHLLTEWHVTRLAVFFPSLVFGWLRSRTKGVGSSVVFHAACNLLVIVLARGYQLIK
ncbi:MAG: JDVT-CTERM system glutamic-type intramembrane protease, partial [Polyangiaceae bacterium]